MQIQLEVAPGELIDKITILEIKLEKFTDTQKIKNVSIELAILREAKNKNVPGTPELDALTAQLKEINEMLWNIEDEIRICEKQKDFSEKFIELARSVYRRNDTRARLKKEINELLGSRIMEEKSYEDY